MAGDQAWLKDRGKSYLPVSFPGFSWQNLEKAHGRESELDAIPRRGGQFLWAQAVANLDRRQTTSKERQTPFERRVHPLLGRSW